MATEKGSSGVTRAQETVETFMMVMLGQRDEFYAPLIYRGRLSRKRVAELCDCGTSALNQNPRLKQLLQELEDKLRGRGLLPNLSEKQKAIKGNSGSMLSPIAINKSTMKDAARIIELEQQVFALQAQIAELDIYIELREVIAELGMVPR